MAIMNRSGGNGPARREPGSGWRRLAWFVGLWVAGVVILSIVATAIRWVLL